MIVSTYCDKCNGRQVDRDGYCVFCQILDPPFSLFYGWPYEFEFDIATGKCLTDRPLTRHDAD